jgi:hypothetical protein
MVVSEQVTAGDLDQQRQENISTETLLELKISLIEKYFPGIVD